jgi:hypothetical protein
MLSVAVLLRVAVLCYLLDTLVVSAAQGSLGLAAMSLGRHSHRDLLALPPPAAHTTGAAAATCLPMCTAFGCCAAPGEHAETVPAEAKPYLHDSRGDSTLLASRTQKLPVHDPPAWHDGGWLHLFSGGYDPGADSPAEALWWGWPP